MEAEVWFPKCKQIGILRPRLGLWRKKYSARCQVARVLVPFFVLTFLLLIFF